VTSSQHGFSNYVYRINATDGNLGSFYAVEPYPSSTQILWQVEQVRFHYPSEHTINGQSFDLEMQIVMTDTLKRATYCKSNRGALSLFFNVTETQGSFWNWVGQPEFNFDLNLAFGKSSAIQSVMFGYVGTDSEPNCDDKFCWYLNYPQQGITQATLDMLKQTGVAWNNR